MDIPNPVIIPSVKRKFSTNHEPLTITFLARIEKTKGKLVFVEMVNKLLESGQNYHFVIAGTGPSLNQVKDNLSKYSESNQLEILGFVSENEKRLSSPK